MYAIQTNQLTKSYGQSPGHRQAQLDRSAGRTIWLYRPNAGNTTIRHPTGAD